MGDHGNHECAGVVRHALLPRGPTTVPQPERRRRQGRGKGPRGSGRGLPATLRTSVPGAATGDRGQGARAASPALLRPRREPLVLGRVRRAPRDLAFRWTSCLGPAPASPSSTASRPWAWAGPSASLSRARTGSSRSTASISSTSSPRGPLACRSSLLTTRAISGASSTSTSRCSSGPTSPSGASWPGSRQRASGSARGVVEERVHVLARCRLRVLRRAGRGTSAVVEVVLHVEVRYDQPTHHVVRTLPDHAEPELLESGSGGPARVGAEGGQTSRTRLLFHPCDESTCNTFPTLVGMDEQHVEHPVVEEVGESCDPTVDDGDAGVGCRSSCVPAGEVDVGCAGPGGDLLGLVVRGRRPQDRLPEGSMRACRVISSSVGAEDARRGRPAHHLTVAADRDVAFPPGRQGKRRARQGGADTSWGTRRAPE